MILKWEFFGVGLQVFMEKANFEYISKLINLHMIILKLRKKNEYQSAECLGDFRGNKIFCAFKWNTSQFTAWIPFEKKEDFIVN